MIKLNNVCKALSMGPGSKHGHCKRLGSGGRLDPSGTSQASGCLSPTPYPEGPHHSPMAMWTDSMGWATVSAQICRLCKASTPSTDSSKSRTAVKSTPLGVPEDGRDGAEGNCSLQPTLVPAPRMSSQKRPSWPADVMLPPTPKRAPSYHFVVVFPSTLNTV